MLRLILAPSFKRDAVEVWDYIGQDSPESADAVLDAVDQTLAMLVRHPYSGRSRDELASGLRSMPSGRYLVYYIPLEGGGIEVLRLLHSARDVEGLF